MNIFFSFFEISRKRDKRAHAIRLILFRRFSIGFFPIFFPLGKSGRSKSFWFWGRVAAGDRALSGGWRVVHCRGLTKQKIRINRVHERGPRLPFYGSIVKCRYTFTQIRKLSFGGCPHQSPGPRVSQPPQISVPHSPPPQRSDPPPKTCATRNRRRISNWLTRRQNKQVLQFRHPGSSEGIGVLVFRGKITVSSKLVTIYLPCQLVFPTRWLPTFTKFH